MNQINDKLRINYIKEVISRSDTWAFNALKVIYEHQTEEEKVVGCTRSLNDIGFTASDSVTLTNIMDYYKRYGFITSKQLYILKQRMPKYSRQILQSPKTDRGKLDKMIIKKIVE